MSKTGDICKTSGIYDGECQQCKAKIKEIPLAVGKKFPPCRKCTGEAVTWTLVRETRY